MRRTNPLQLAFFTLVGGVFLAGCGSSSSSGGTGGSVSAAAGQPGSGGGVGGAVAGATSSIAGSGGSPAGAAAGNNGTGGAPLSSGGSNGGTSAAGMPGTAGTIGAAGAGAGAAGSGGTGLGTAGAGNGTVTAAPNPLAITGVRAVTTPAATSVLKLHNSGTSAVAISALTLTGGDAKLFQITSPPTLPLMLAPGADHALTLTVSTSTGLPTAPAQNSGATALSAALGVTYAGGSAQIPVFGLVLTTSTHEPTLGQILTALGYKMNVGQAQNNANPNTGGTATLPGVEMGTDEISAQLFQKAGAGNVTLQAVARFSPKAPCPFGWYPMGTPDMRNTVGTMADTPDAQTSDKARLVAPPVTGTQSFDPGTQTFGTWVYTDQKTRMYDPTDPTDSGLNGDYDYSQDSANLPAGTHRTKVYPLKDAAGVSIPNSYLLAIEEAANGDYQDYVMVLGNAKVAP